MFPRAVIPLQEVCLIKSPGQLILTLHLHHQKLLHSFHHIIPPPLSQPALLLLKNLVTTAYKLNTNPLGTVCNLPRCLAHASYPFPNFPWFIYWNLLLQPNWSVILKHVHRPLHIIVHTTFLIPNVFPSQTDSGVQGQAQDTPQV